jgi:hypothetical protein
LCWSGNPVVCRMISEPAANQSTTTSKNLTPLKIA